MAMDGMMLPPPVPPIAVPAGGMAPDATPGAPDFQAMVAALAGLAAPQGAAAKPVTAAVPEAMAMAEAVPGAVVQAAMAMLAGADGGAEDAERDAACALLPETVLDVLPPVADAPSAPTPTPAPGLALVQAQGLMMAPPVMAPPAQAAGPPAPGADAPAPTASPAMRAVAEPETALPAVTDAGDHVAAPVAPNRAASAVRHAAPAPARAQAVAAPDGPDAPRRDAPMPPAAPPAAAIQAVEHPAPRLAPSADPAPAVAARMDAAVPDPAAAPVPPAGTPSAPETVALDAPAPRALPAAPVRQVAALTVTLAARDRDEDRLSVALDPAELGRVEISIERQGTTAQVRVLAERPETLTLLQRDQRELDRLLGQAGIGEGGRALSFGLSDGSGQGGGQSQSQPQRHGGGGQTAPFVLPERGAAPRAVLGLLDIAI